MINNRVISQNFRSSPDLIGAVYVTHMFAIAINIIDRSFDWWWARFLTDHGDKQASVAYAASYQPSEPRKRSKLSILGL